MIIALLKVKFFSSDPCYEESFFYYLIMRIVLIINKEGVALEIEEGFERGAVKERM